MTSLVVLLLWLINTTHCIDVQNSHSVSKWWYQCLIHDSTYPLIYTITNVQVRSYHTLEYVSCNYENWPPYPWTCETDGANSLVPPLTVKLINSLGQILIIEDIITDFFGSTRFNSTSTFIDPPTTTPTTTTPTTPQPTPMPNTDPTPSPLTLSPTLSTLTPTNTPTTTTTTTTTTVMPDTPFLGSELQFPYFVGYINKVLCNIGDDVSCLSSIGLPGYSIGVAHQYNVLNFGSYIISNQTGINVLEFWFNPRQYLSGETIVSLTGDWSASNTEIRIILHNIYARYDIKILLSTFGEEDDDIIRDNWISTTMSRYTIATKLANIVRNYWFDGININFNTEQSIYFDDVASGEIDLIILTESINSALNRNSANPYFIITHTASSLLFEKSNQYPMGGFLMLHEYCSHLIKWYNIKYYDSNTITYNSFDTIFKTYNTSLDYLLLGTNKQNIAINSGQIVITKSASKSDINGYIPAITFANIISRAVSRGYPYWGTGFMIFDFLTDEQNNFDYSLTLIPSFNPTSAPTLPSPEPTRSIAIYPTVPKYSPDDNTFDLLNLNSYQWGEWFFLCTMLIILCCCCVGVGCCYHRYKVRDRILTDDQIQDLEDDMNKTAISDSWRRLSKLLVRTDSIDNNKIKHNPMAMNEEQATRALGQSIYKENIQLAETTDELAETTDEIELQKGEMLDDIPEMVGQSLENKVDILNTKLDNNMSFTND
eukprot:174121_1